MAELSFKGRRILARETHVQSSNKGYVLELHDVYYRPKNSDDDADPKPEEIMEIDGAIVVTWKDFKAHGKVVMSPSLPSFQKHALLFELDGSCTRIWIPLSCQATSQR